MSSPCFSCTRYISWFPCYPTRNGLSPSIPLPGAEDPGSIPNTHMVVHNHFKLQFQGIQQFSQPSTGTGHTCGAHKDGKRSHTENNREKVLACCLVNLSHSLFSKRLWQPMTSKVSSPRPIDTTEYCTHLHTTPSSPYHPFLHHSRMSPFRLCYILQCLSPLPSQTSGSF